MHLTDEQSSAYVDGALSPAERSSARLHLDACAACAAELAALEAVQARLAVPLLEPSADFEARTLAKLRAMPMPRAPWWGFLRVPVFRVSAAAFAVLTLVTVGAYEAGYFGAPSAEGIPAPAVVSAEDADVADQADFLEHLDMLEELDALEAMDRVPG